MVLMDIFPNRTQQSLDPDQMMNKILFQLRFRHHLSKKDILMDPVWTQYGLMDPVWTQFVSFIKVIKTLIINHNVQANNRYKGVCVQQLLPMHIQARF